MKAIFGLGNPGLEYRETRHNIGFMVVDYLAHFFLKEFVSTTELYKLAKVKYSGETVLLVKPQTYMNLSGVAVKHFIDENKLQIGNIFVVVDDFQLPFGTIRIRAGGSDGGHNGLKSIIQNLDTDNFTRMRIGIGKPDMRDVVNFVLSNFSLEEQKNLDPVIEMAASASKEWVNTDLNLLMNKFNRTIIKSGG